MKFKTAGFGDPLVKTVYPDGPMKSFAAAHSRSRYRFAGSSPWLWSQRRRLLLSIVFLSVFTRRFFRLLPILMHRIVTRGCALYQKTSEIITVTIRKFNSDDYKVIFDYYSGLSKWWYLFKSSLVHCAK